MGSTFSQIGKVIRKVDPFRAGGTDILVEKIGLPTGTGKGEKNLLDFGQTAAAEAAAQAELDRAKAEQVQAETNRLQQEQTDRLNEINRNQAQDLRAENRAQVIAGGTAAAVDQTADDIRKKRAGAGLSSTLGINVG